MESGKFSGDDIAMLHSVKRHKVFRRRREASVAQSVARSGDDDIWEQIDILKVITERNDQHTQLPISDFARTRYQIQCLAIPKS